MYHLRALNLLLPISQCVFSCYIHLSNALTITCLLKWLLLTRRKYTSGKRFNGHFPPQGSILKVEKTNVCVSLISNYERVDQIPQCRCIILQTGQPSNRISIRMSPTPRRVIEQPSDAPTQPHTWGSFPHPWGLT